jgi:5-methylcytosine-specific restriction enzyme subunit McrC
MVGLRTVTVLEHEVIRVFDSDPVPDVLADVATWLTEVEAQALLSLNDLRRGFCQRVSGGIKLAQHCGIVRLSTCVVEVLPKVGMADSRTINELERSRGALLAMLHSARQVAITKVGTAPQQSVSAPLLDIFIEAFLHCALDQARRGLISRYVVHADDLSVIKGRFQAHGHVRRNLVRPHLLHCEYDEFTADNAYNRAVRATLNVCRTWVSAASTQRLWFETHARYASISSVRVLAKDVAALPRDRTTQRYDPLLTWCELILAMTSTAMSSGTTQAPGLLFDMNKLFEAHVAKLEEDAVGPDQSVVRQGPPLHLGVRDATNVFLLKPDITVWKVDQNGARLGIDRVVDAKWKRLNPYVPDYGVNEGDVYQLLAYATRYGCTNLELAYPMPDGEKVQIAPPTFKISSAGNDVSKALEIKIKLVSIG